MANENSLLLLKLDDSEIKKLAENIQNNAEDALKKAAGDLASQVHAKVVSLAQEGLHARRERYIAALSFQNVNESTWMIELSADALWIEEGLPENYQMLPKLLGSAKAKVSKDGSKYIVVPFNQGPGARHPNSESGKTNDDLKMAVQSELKKRKIPFAKIERDINTGQPKLGKLHDIDFLHPLEHPKKTHEGIGQGQGPVGAARQGHTGDRYLDRIRVYQKMVKGKNGQPRVQRGIMTFRTASSKQNGSQYWVHPGSAPMRFFEEAFSWALREWETVMVPKILADLQK